MPYICNSCQQPSLTGDSFGCRACWLNMFPFCEIDNNDLSVLLVNCKGNAVDGSSTQLLSDEIMNYDTLKSVDHYSKYLLPSELLRECNHNDAKKIYSIFNLNCRSLASSFDKLCLLFDELSYIKYDVIVLTETWTISRDNNEAIFKILGYRAFFLNRDIKRGGGIAIYAKDTFESELIEWATVTVNNIIEVLTVTVGRGTSQICVSGVYRPPNGNFQNFSLKIEELLTKFKNQSLYVVGDFNLNLLATDDSCVKRFSNLMASFSMKPLITRPTRITGTTETLIDNIFTNQNHKVLMNGILICDISDHLPSFVLGNVFSNSERVKKKTNFKKVLTREGIKKFNDKLLKINWVQEFEGSDLDSNVDKFYKIYNNIYLESLVLIHIDEKINISYKPWITLGLMKSSFID